MSTQPRRDEYTVTIWFYDGFSSTRDLPDHASLVRYVSEGVAMYLLKSMTIVHNPPHPES